MQFSEDNQLLLALSGAPDWMLMIWNWARAKMIAAVSVSLAGTPMYKCMFSPLDASVATVIGKDTVKFFRIGEREVRPLQENTLLGNNFTAFCWMRNPDDHLLVGTSEGKIMLFRAGEFLMTLKCSPGRDHPITSLVSIIGGFVAGSAQGTFYFYSYDESKDQALFENQFSLVNEISANDLAAGSIIQMAICPKDERITALSDDGQILVLPAVYPHTLTLENIKYAAAPFHGPKPITGLDMALKKPIILTCSKDATLRLWNFKNHTLDIQKTFAEEMFSVALHPTGLHCAVGFSEKLRAFHILVNDFRQCMEVPIKACRECRFSPGGNYLAATNGNAVVVYDFHTGEKVADLRGHNSKVRALYWLNSGSQLLTCGAEGAVYLWSLEGARRTGEFIQKGIGYSSVVYSGNSVLVVGNDRSLRELTIPDLMPSKLTDAGLVLTHIALAMNKSVLFASTFEHAKPGYIRAYPYPLSGEFDDYPCTSSPIQRLRVTPDENFLTVVDEQGCIVIMEIRGRQDRFQRNNPGAYPELMTVGEWSDETLVTRAELDEYDNTVQELKTKVAELESQTDYQLKILDRNNTEKLAEATNKFRQDLEIAKSRYEMLQEVRLDYEVETLEKIRYMEEMHQNQIQQMETSFQAQIMELVDQYQRLVRERDAQIERLDEHRRLLVDTHERLVNELTHEYDDKVNENQRSRMKEEEERNELEKELAEMQNQLDDDIDTEIDHMKKRYETQLQICREATMKYKQDNSTLRKKQAMLQRSIEDIAEEHKHLEMRDKELMEQSQVLQKEVQAHKKEIKTRDATIFEKEKRISELKKKNQELDKFKFVLDFKIRELKQQIEPRQKEIMDKRQQIKKLDEELEKFHKSNAQLDHLIGDLRGKIDAMQGDVKDKRIAAKKLENAMNTCRSEVQSAMAYIQQPAELTNMVHHIVMKYGSAELIKPRIDTEVEEEYNRHRQYLQHSIQELKRNLELVSTQHRSANAGIREQNMSLIQQINHQREENKSLKAIVQAEIGRIRHLLNNQQPGGGSGAGHHKHARRSGSVTSSMKSAGGAGGANGAVPGHSDSNNGLLMNLPGVNILNDPGLMAQSGGAGGLGTNPEFLDPAEMLLYNQRRIAALTALLDDIQARGMTLLTQALPRNLSSENIASSSRPTTAGGSSLPPITSSSGNNNQPGSAQGSRKNSGAAAAAVSLPPIHQQAQGGYGEGIAALSFEDSVASPRYNDLSQYQPQSPESYPPPGEFLPASDTLQIEGH